jgi:hypothetical protein
MSSPAPEHSAIERWIHTSFRDQASKGALSVKHMRAPTAEARQIMGIKGERAILAPKRDDMYNHAASCAL